MLSRKKGFNERGKDYNHSSYAVSYTHLRWYLCHWGYDYLYDAVQTLKDENPKAATNIKSHHVLFKIPDVYKRQLL